MASVGRTVLKGVIAIPAIAAGLFLAAYLLTWGDHAVAPTVADDPSLPRIEVNGAVLHGEAFGDPEAPVLVVVHGGPGGDFRALLPLRALADRFHVIFYDQRGSGLSARVPAEELTLETFVADLDAVIDAFAGDEPAHLVGHSWGGGLAAIYAARHPDRVGRLVLAEPVPLTPEMEAASGITYGASFDLRVLLLGTLYWMEALHVEASDRHARPDYLFTKMAPRANPEHHCRNGVGSADPDTVMWRSGSLAIESIRGSLLDEGGGLRDDLLDGIDRYRGEVLFLAGECSALIGPDFQARQMALFPHARIVLVADSGHMMFTDQPAHSVNAVRSYLLSDRR